jgi:DegV family protein with EDD domain
MLESESVSPKTSQPSVKAFEQLYGYLLAHYDSVISMHLSQVLSGTYNTAKIAAEKCDPYRISVIDTKNLSTTFGLMVLNVVQRIAHGDSHQDVCAFAESLYRKTKIFVSVPTLKYMIRSGRVSPLKGILANSLHLKPIISLDSEGKTELYGKALGMKSNINKILKMIESFHRNSPVKQYAIGHAHATEEARKFEARIQKILGKKAEYIIEISPAIGVHAGIGALSVSLLAE